MRSRDRSRPVPARPGICPRCGGSEWIKVDASHWRCGDCGLGSTISLLTARSTSGASSAELGDHRAAMRATRDRWRQAFAAATFTPYGLDDQWTGPRWVGGHGTSNNRVTSLRLAHGDRGMTEPQLRVETRIPQIGGLDQEVVNAAHHLVMGFAHDVGGIRDDVRRALFPRGGASEPLAPWTPLALGVAGQAQTFRLLVEGDHWIAVGALDTVVLALRGRAWDPGTVSLETIWDLTSYAV
jgi:ribosomal protein S27AE